MRETQTIDTGMIMAPISSMHLITELDRGGAETALLRFLTHQNRARYRSTVVCLFNGDSSIAGEIRALGIDVIDLRMKQPYRIDALFRLYRLLRRSGPVFSTAGYFTPT
jgi:hypothetical protein